MRSKTCQATVARSIVRAEALANRLTTKNQKSRGSSRIIVPSSYLPSFTVAIDYPCRGIAPPKERREWGFPTPS